MPTDHLPAGRPGTQSKNQTPEKRRLSPAAERALAEAAARRAERENGAGGPPKEVNGRGGADPTRYGDWEINGLAADF